MDDGICPVCRHPSCEGTHMVTELSGHRFLEAWSKARSKLELPSRNSLTFPAEKPRDPPIKLIRP
jgi:hypothetical protein